MIRTCLTVGSLARRTGNSTHPGSTYTSSASPTYPTHPADPYPTYPSHSIHPAYPYPAQPAEFSTHTADPYTTHPTDPYPTYPTHSIHPASPYPTCSFYSTQHTHLYPTHITHRARPIHPSNPTQSVSPSYDLSSSSVNIQQVHQSANSWVTPVSRFPEGQVIRRAITFPHESLEQLIGTEPEVASTTLRTPQSTVSELHGEKLRKTAIEMLPEEILLEIFDLYRLDAVKQSGGRLWKWYCLAHVCKKWRRVISTSPRRLDLQILCEYGALVESILDAWPTLPFVVRYNSSKSRSLSKDIIVALRRPDRVCEIDFVLSSSLIGLIIPVIQEPFPGLERIRITVEDTWGSPLLVRGSFLGGSSPLVREINLDGIGFTFPAIRQVLSSTNNLVKLQLSNIHNGIYFSPVELANALSTLIHLESLVIGFHSPASRPPQPEPPPSTMTRRPRTTEHSTFTLSSLTHLDFHGNREYLEELVSQIDLPSLCKLTIKLFNQILFETRSFCQFTPPLKAFEPPAWVFITHTVESVNVMFVQACKPLNGNCCFKTSCRRLDLQLSFVIQVTTQLSPFFLSSVQSLIIEKTLGVHMPTGVEDVDSARWLKLFRPFSHVTRVHVRERRFVPGIVQALAMEEEGANENVVAAGVLPELNSLYLDGYRDSPSVVKGAEQFVSSRRLAGRPVRLLG